MARFKRGETPKLTPELIGQISNELRRGEYVEKAASTCGISKDTFYRWLHAARGPFSTPILRDLWAAVAAVGGESSLGPKSARG